MIKTKGRPWRTRYKTGPVTVTRMPQARCQQCGQVMYYPPGMTLSEALTRHYRLEHG